MKVPAKRIVLDADDPLFRKVYPVLLHVFCRGVQAAASKRLMLGALLSIATSPVAWVLAIFSKVIHLAILLAVWWFLREFIAQYELPGHILLSLGIIAIFYKDIYDELLNIFLNSLIVGTRGGYLRWVCTGYLSGTGVRQKLLTTKPMEAIVASMEAVIPNRYRDHYDEIMDLYLDSNEPGNEDKLNLILEEYSY